MYSHIINVSHIRQKYTFLFDIANIIAIFYDVAKIYYISDRKQIYN